MLIKDQVILLKNLKQRCEFNEKTKLWSIKGSITCEEFVAFSHAIDVLSELRFES